MLTELMAAAAPPAQPPDPDDARLLAAAVEQVAAFGYRRTTMEDVARAAGVGRMTAYRRFGSKDELLRRMLWNEAATLIAAIVEAGAATARRPLADRMVDGFVAAVTRGRRHPLVARAMRLEPDDLMDLARMEEPDLVGLATNAVAVELARARKGRVSAADRATAEALVRLAISYVLMPRSVIDVDDPEALRRLAQSTVAPIVAAATRRSPTR